MTDVFGADFLDRLHGAGAVQNAAAFAALRERGFPNRRVEAWRYTDLAGPLGKALTPAGLRINQEQSGLFGPIPPPTLPRPPAISRALTPSACSTPASRVRAFCSTCPKRRA